MASQRHPPLLQSPADPAKLPGVVRRFRYAEWQIDKSPLAGWAASPNIHERALVVENRSGRKIAVSCWGLPLGLLGQHGLTHVGQRGVVPPAEVIPTTGELEPETIARIILPVGAVTFGLHIVGADGGELTGEEKRNVWCVPILV